MIILDAEEQERSKRLRDFFSGGPTLRFPEKAASRSDSPLPDYETSEAHQKLIVKELSARSKRIEPRLWRAILYALGIYILFTIIIGVPIIVVKKNQSHSVPPINPAEVWDTDGPPNDYSINVATNWDNDKLTRCQWGHLKLSTSSPYTAHAEHNLTYSGSFYIRSNISDVSSNTNYSIGDLVVDLNPDTSVSQVLLTVDVAASSDDLLRHTSACFINTEDDKGVLMSMTRPLQNTDIIAVKIKILLPHKGSSTLLDDFVTDLPGFSHTFGDLKNYTIQNIALSGARYNVSAGSLKGYNISVKNSYASIIGDFYATSSLTLDGIKGNIHANITLEQSNSSKTPTSLLLDTGDGSIEADVTLVAPSKARPYSFNADVRTFNGPLTFRAHYANSTPPTPLLLTVTNTDGTTDVSLDEKFEGIFNAQSKLGRVNVSKPFYVSPTLDPLGKRRQYTYQTIQTGDHSQTGWVGWGKPKKYHENGDKVTQGQVKVTTSLSPITLRLATP